MRQLLGRQPYLAPQVARARKGRVRLREGAVEPFQRVIGLAGAAHVDAVDDVGVEVEARDMISPAISTRPVLAT